MLRQQNACIGLDLFQITHPEVVPGVCVSGFDLGLPESMQRCEAGLSTSRISLAKPSAPGCRGVLPAQPA